MAHSHKHAVAADSDLAEGLKALPVKELDILVHAAEEETRGLTYVEQLYVDRLAATTAVAEKRGIPLQAKDDALDESEIRQLLGEEGLPQLDQLSDDKVRHAVSVLRAALEDTRDDLAEVKHTVAAVAGELSRRDT